MRDKVIFDTNIVRNPEINYFLGGREILERFSKDADIVIPDTVIQEIKRQKRTSLTSNKTKFLTNPFHKLIGINELDTKSFDIEVYIQSLIDNETITFEIIDLKDNSVLPKIKELAINKKPPFEAGDNTDKGFKDALIYFSILEYLQEIPNKYVYVCAKDARFKEALAIHSNIIIIESYDDFKKHGISQFTNDYFIEKISDVLGQVITKDNILEFWYNVDYNHNILVKVDDNEYVMEVDSGEIINTANRNLFQENIQRLIISVNFADTHNLVEKLTPFLNFFTNDEIISILGASCSNSQISWIIGDDDVKGFIGTLYAAKEELVDEETADFLSKIFK